MKSRKPFYLRFRCTKSRRVFGWRPKLFPGRRLMKDEKRCGRPTGLPTSLFFILIPKRKELSRGPASAQLFSSYQKKRIDDERPHRSPFVVNSYHLLPGRPLLARSLSALSTGPNPHAMRREKVAAHFLTTFTTTFTTT